MTRKCTGYQLAVATMDGSCDTQFDMESLVNKLITQGYEPVGGLLTCPSFGGAVIIQPMARYEEV